MTKLSRKPARVWPKVYVRKVYVGHLLCAWKKTEEHKINSLHAGTGPLAGNLPSRDLAEQIAIGNESVSKVIQKWHISVTAIMPMLH